MNSRAFAKLKFSHDFDVENYWKTVVENCGEGHVFAVKN
jgi:hypothetical protein